MLQNITETFIMEKIQILTKKLPKVTYSYEKLCVHFYEILRFHFERLRDNVFPYVIKVSCCCKLT